MSSPLWRRLRLAALASGALVAMFMALGTGRVGAETWTVTMSEDVFWSFTTWSSTITIHPGDTVTWVNNGQVRHNATAEDGSWRSGELTRGQTFSRVFTTPGEYRYLCTLHIAEEMFGKVIVAAPGASVSPTATSTPRSTMTPIASATPATSARHLFIPYSPR